MKFKVGDNVSVLDDDLSGIVIEIVNEDITIQTDDGFHMNFKESQLIKMGGSELIFDNRQVFDHEEKEFKRPKTKQKSKVKKTGQPVYEVDLHIENLLPSYKGMDNQDILSFQLDTARRKLEFAIQKRIQRLVFIHGVGDGILKLELEHLIMRYDGISFQDADYQKYGIGATEVYIQQNAQRN